MNGQQTCIRVTAALIGMLFIAPPALAQSGQHDHGADATQQQSAPAAPTARGAGGMMGMMGAGGMIGMHPGMMEHRGMGGGMNMPCGRSEDGMMHRMMAMMHQGAIPGRHGMAKGGEMGGGGMRVMPVQHLTEEDVQHFFEHWLTRVDNSRLKLGPVQQTDDDNITADIVTVDDSLVQRFLVDRHSGQVTVDRS